jgi:hypothetical protein
MLGAYAPSGSSDASSVLPSGRRSAAMQGGEKSSKVVLIGLLALD